jgi:prolyl-tRNA synthetase
MMLSKQVRRCWQKPHSLVEKKAIEVGNIFSMGTKYSTPFDLKYKDEKYKCIGFGAAAKGQTVLCYANIFLDYIIDENPLKIGLYSPKLNIPIVEISKLKEDTSEKILILILAWNFSKEIIEKIKKVNKNVVIIKKYLPCLEIIHI